MTGKIFKNSGYRHFYMHISYTSVTQPVQVSCTLLVLRTTSSIHFLKITATVWRYPHGGPWSQTLYPNLVEASLRDDNRPASIPSISLMRKVIKSEFSHVRKPLRGEWKDCSTCYELRNRKVSTDTERVRLIEEKKLHKILVRGERKVMTQREEEAKMNPSSKLMLLFDYTKASHLPHFRSPNNPVSFC
jgi:hypothetical protein